MITSLIGIKTKQTQQFTQEGNRIPVTYLTMGPCYVTGLTQIHDKTMVQIGFGTKTTIHKAQQGQLTKAGLTQKLRFLRSFGMNEADETVQVGKEIRVESLFAENDAIRVTGTSKGKGFAGVVKRHGFAGGPKTHGQSDRERAPGSIGQTTTPGRVYKGKRMAGRMGSDRVTVRGLKVISVIPETQTIVVKGLVPGGTNGLVIVTKE